MILADASGKLKPCTQHIDCSLGYFCNQTENKCVGVVECISDEECGNGAICKRQQCPENPVPGYRCKKLCQPEVAEGCEHWGKNCRICKIKKKQDPCEKMGGVCQHNGKCLVDGNSK